MRLFVTHRFRRGSYDITVRLNQRGEAQVLEATTDGIVIGESNAKVDPVRAQRLVEQAFRYTPRIPHLGGDTSFGIGRGRQQPEVRSCSRDQLPPEVEVLGRQLESLAAWVSQNGRRAAPEPKASPAPTTAFDRGSFAAWTAVFFCAHFLAIGLGSLLAVGATEIAGATATVSALMGIVAVGALAHGGLGSLVGRAFGDSAPAWGPALAAVVAFIAIKWLGVSDPGMLELVTLTFPLFAALGQTLRVRGAVSKPSVDSSLNVPNLAT